MRRVPRVKTLRRALALTQEEFTKRYDIPIGTLRDWEQGRTEPDQAARAYLNLIAQDPVAASRRKQHAKPMARKNYQFATSDYRHAVSDYENNWQLIDDILLKLCRDHLDHTNRAAVNAKVQIIGLTYGTGIQRSVALRGNGPGRALYQVAELLFNQHERVDKLLAAICTIGEPLTLEGLRTVVSAHGCFVDLLGQVTRKSSSGSVVCVEVFAFPWVDRSDL